MGGISAARRPRAGRSSPRDVLQTAAVSTALPTVLLVPLTTQQDALRFPGTILVETDADNGLHRPSIALIFQLTTVDKQFLSGQIGRVSDAVLSAIWAAFDELAGR